MRANFLIACEDLNAIEALGALLFDTGFGGKRVGSGAEALAELERGSYDVIIADQRLSDVPGGSLPQTLRARGIELPVVVLVAAAAVADGVAAVRTGAADFLRKPIEREEVLYVLREALRSVEIEADEPPRSIDLAQSALELEVTLKKAERRALERALKSAAGNKNVAARLLGISRRSLYYKLEEHGLGAG